MSKPGYCKMQFLYCSCCCSGQFFDMKCFFRNKDVCLKCIILFLVLYQIVQNSMTSVLFISGMLFVIIGQRKRSLFNSFPARFSQNRVSLLQLLVQLCCCSCWCCCCCCTQISFESESRAAHKKSSEHATIRVRAKLRKRN